MENEEKISNTPWQIRCSPEQKQFFQQFVAQSGLSAQEVIARAFESFRIQVSENSEEKKVLLEFDSLIMRLQSVMRAQIVTALEKQKQCSEEEKRLQEEKEKYQIFHEETYAKIQAEFEDEKRILENKQQESIEQLSFACEEKLKNKDIEYLKLKEKYEHLEASNQQLERDKDTLQKQYNESMRSYEIADERLLECRTKLRELEEKLKGFEAIKEEKRELEKEVTVLQVKLDALAKEESLKREYLEKDLRREFEIKEMQLKREVN